jgi:putative component of membrane protein insertase Oxa1/YidC/SpoIIIJ protein YidD
MREGEDPTLRCSEKVECPFIPSCTNAHSKSLKHHTAMVAILVAWYNFCRTHQTIKKTPAMAAGLTDHVWTIKELIERAA